MQVMAGDPSGPRVWTESDGDFPAGVFPHTHAIH